MDHDHGHARAGERHRRPLTIAFVLVAAFFVVEVVGAFATSSLALLSDAGHMLTDVVSLGMALAAVHLATRFERRSEHTRRRSGATFGLYRLEILAAFVNALVLLGVAGYVLVEAVRRLGDEAKVATGPLLVIAVLGLVVNLIAFVLLREGATESLNVRGAYLEVLADAVSSAGVIVAALTLELFGWAWIDPVVGAAIGLWVLPRAVNLGHQAARILLQAAPPHIDLGRLHDDLAALDGVVDVHDLHVWTLTSDMEAASAHLMVAQGADHHGVLDQARSLLTGQYGIEHATFQVEPETHEGCSTVTW